MSLLANGLSNSSKAIIDPLGILVKRYLMHFLLVQKDQNPGKEVILMYEDCSANLNCFYASPLLI